MVDFQKRFDAYSKLCVGKATFRDGCNYNTIGKEAKHAISTLNANPDVDMVTLRITQNIDNSYPLFINETGKPCKEIELTRLCDIFDGFCVEHKNQGIVRAEFQVYPQLADLNYDTIVVMLGLQIRCVKIRLTFESGVVSDVKLSYNAHYAHNELRKEIAMACNSDAGLYASGINYQRGIATLVSGYNPALLHA